MRDNDNIITINDIPINDQIDYKYHISDDIINIVIKRDSGEFEIQIEKEPDDDLGIILEKSAIKRCTNKCVFCFIDQNPPDLRKSLYVKDEDYRFSFLYGNYITMCNIGEEDIERIIGQKLSPLYVSVHAIDKKVRKILGIYDKRSIIDIIKDFTEGEIELHGQVVLCPGINDGSVLKETIFELFNFYPRFRSLSVVPVGLTRFRNKLYSLETINKKYAEKTLSEISEYQSYIMKNTDERFVYPSDELFLKADVPIPSEDYYDNYYQIENGVGLTRYFLKNFYAQSKSFPNKLKTKRHLCLVTGESAYVILKNEVLPVLKNIENCEVSLIAVKNDFLGHTVTVSGLLSGQDIAKAINNSNCSGIFILPSNCINDDGLFLDDWSLKDLKERTSRDIIIYHDNWFAEYLNN